MKKLIFVLALLLIACRSEKRVVVEKYVSPPRIGACENFAREGMPLRLYLPVEGGECHGTAEYIPEQYFFVLDDGYEVRVSYEEYSDMAVGDGYK